MNNTVEIDPSNTGVVTHQPPPYYDPTKVQTGQVYSQNPQGPMYAQQHGQVYSQNLQGPMYAQQNGQVYSQNPQGPMYVQPNGQIVAVPYVVSGAQFTTAAQPTAKTVDYLNTIWSVINTCCCLWPLGLIALIISICTLRMRRRGDNKGAKIAGISTAVINVLATIGGILLIILYFMPLIKNSNTY